MDEVESYLLDNIHEFAGFARKRLSDPELAADAVQDSLLKALKAADQLHDEESVKAWFYRILRRTIIDLYRRRDARGRMLAELEQELNSPPDFGKRTRCMRLYGAAAADHGAAVRRFDPAS